MSKSAIVVMSSAGGVASSLTGRLTSTVVIAFARGTKVWVRAVGKQQASFGRPGVAVFEYRARMTTTCIGPVRGPTATCTWVTVPVPGGASEMLRPWAAWNSAGVGTCAQMHELAGRVPVGSGNVSGCPRNGL